MAHSCIVDMSSHLCRYDLFHIVRRCGLIWQSVGGYISCHICVGESILCHICVGTLRFEGDVLFINLEFCCRASVILIEVKVHPAVWCLKK